MYSNVPVTNGQAVTTVTQMLGDGTRIEQKTEAKFYRDSAGRIRREQTILGLAALNPSAQSRTVVTIDPTPDDAFAYTLDPVARTARRVPRASGAYPNYVSGDAVSFGLDNLANRFRAATATYFTTLNPRGGAITQLGTPVGARQAEESLGTRQIEGVRAIGRRTTSTIPAGQIGNDRPIEITDERWESPDLKVLVLVQQYPTRFGLFAAMPLPDIDATLKEIAYAYDTLKVDGVGLFTSYGDTWLGNAAFRPVMEELNRRKAVVHVHPTAANCCRNLDYGTPPGSLEYGTDTTRAIIGVTFNGDTTRYPDIRFIWSHAGGSAPFLASRIDGGSGNAKDRMPAGFMAEAKKFYYDTAGAANRGAIASLLELVSSSQILFGTDFPPGGTNLALAKAVAELGFFKENDLRAIERENAVRLLPRLKASAL